MIEISYSNNTDIDGIQYSTGYVDKIYIDSDFSKPEYIIDKEGEENGNGDTVYSFKKWTKKQSFEAIVTESEADILTRLPIYDNVDIGNYENVEELNVELEWQDNATKLAKITMTFNVYSIINRITNINLT